MISGKSKEEMQSRIQELKSLQGVQLEQKYNQLKDTLGGETENCEEYKQNATNIVSCSALVYFIFIL